MLTTRLDSIMADCSVCCEKLNNSNRKSVCCPFCDFNSCRSCTQHYLLSVSSDPHCMSCKNVWNREFIDVSCTKTFRNKDLKNHRETILFERDKCMLPQAQPAVQRMKQIRVTNELWKEARAELERQKLHVWELERQLNALRNGAPLDTVQQKKEFIKKCPMEECRGFLNTQWKCGTCSKNICKDCNEENLEGHECDPGVVETVKLLKKDTKGCPKCGTMIFRISGCSQMWCPDCHTAFNWNTMKIETGVIHNPHYYEFQRRNGPARQGRNLGDIPCGGFPTYYELRASAAINDRQLHSIHRLISHIQNYEFRYNYVDREVNNMDLRVGYLMNEINEERYKSTLQKREKLFHRKRDIANILRMFSDTGGDFMRQIIQNGNLLSEIKGNFAELIEYSNTQLMKVSERYNCTVPYINNEYDLDNKKWNL